MRPVKITVIKKGYLHEMKNARMFGCFTIYYSGN